MLRLMNKAMIEASEYLAYFLGYISMGLFQTTELPEYLQEDMMAE